jgi:nucleoid DNA-binding protein
MSSLRHALPRTQGKGHAGARSAQSGTGATIKVAAARTLTFAPAKTLKDALNK